jgi:cell division protein FtsA
MAKRALAVGIDIGTTTVKVVVARQSESDGLPEVVGVGVAESKGLRNGFISNHADAIKGVRKAIRLAEKACGERIRHAYVGIGGIGLESITSEATVAVSRADGEVTPLDVKNLNEQCQSRIPQHIMLNHHILHTLPLSYALDGQKVHGNPIGMRGSSLTGTTMFVTCLKTHHNDFIRVVEECDVEVVGFAASPIAASLTSLSRTQKVFGCALANIGSETLSLIVYEEGLPISVAVFPIGSNNITNDIALGLRVSLEEAEAIKMGEETAPATPRRKLDEIVMARMSDMFELVSSHLRKINRPLLPGGIIISGGGSGVTTIEDLARAYLQIPSKVIKSVTNREKVEIRDSMWSVAYGLCVYALNDTDFSGGAADMRSPWWSSIVSWFKQFLP